MKPLLALICAALIGWIAYDAVYPPFATYFNLAKKEEPPPPPPVPMPQIAIVVPKVEEPKPVEPMPETKPEPKPEVAAAPPPPPAPPKPKPGDFVPPDVPSVEDYTKNWTVLPKTFFPRKVKLSKELEVKGTVGGTKIAAGAEAYATEMQGTDLVVGPSPESPFKGKIALADTNVKEVFTQLYEQNKALTIENARKLWAAEQEAKKNPKKAVPKKLSDDKPVAAKDGSYEILLESMAAGEVTEIKKDNILKWGDVKKKHVEGTDYWEVGLTFTAKTPFGNFEQEAVARVKNQKVVKWLYAGSGEVIP